MSVILQVEASAALMYTIDFVIFTFQCGTRAARGEVGKMNWLYQGVAVDSLEGKLYGVFGMLLCVLFVCLGCLSNLNGIGM